MTYLPAICRTCGLRFQSSFPFNLGKGCAVTGCATSCPRCGGTAQILDSYTDSEGNLHVRDLFQYVSNLRNDHILESIKTHLNAANNDITADELIETLVEIDPGFSKYKDLIRSIPKRDVHSLIQTIITIITLIVMIYATNSENESNQESISIQQSQLELSRQEFEYRKRYDKDLLADDKQSRAEKDELLKRLEQAQRDFENRLQSLEKPNNHNKQASDHAKKSSLKGSDRNKPCPCGSGLKAKKCHPHGYKM